MAKITERQKSNIIAKWNTGEYTKVELAKYYKVSESAIRKVISGETKIKTHWSSIGKNTTTKKGQLYIIRAGSTNFFKIGLTRGVVEKRLQTLQTGNHLKLTIYHTSYYEDVIKKEKQIHIKYKDSRTVGEWFMLTEDEIQLIIQYDLMECK